MEKIILKVIVKYFNSKIQCYKNREVDDKKIICRGTGCRHKVICICKIFISKIMFLIQALIPKILRMYCLVILNIQKGLIDNEVLGISILDIEKVSRAGKRIICRREEQTTVYVPPHFNTERDGTECIMNVPELCLVEIDNALVVGETNIISTGNILYTDIESSLIDKVDLAYGDLIFNNRKCAIIYKREEKIIEDKVISLIKAGNNNYYHFMIESLSKLVLADEVEEYRHLPILVDKVVKNNSNLKMILDKCNIYNHPIIWLEKNTHYRVASMIYASDTTFMPGNLKSRDYFDIEDYIVSKWLLIKLRDRLRFQDETVSSYKKIIISRRDTSNSRLINEKEVVDYFINNKYEVVYPEKLTVEEQSVLFASSKLIVASTGAAMANMIFCQPGTKIFCIMPDDFKFYLYSSMAYLLGLEYVAINAEITKKEAYIAMDEYKVDVEELKKVFGESSNENGLNN
ncbi:Protein of unknown function [Pseudobutyrivibrio sp. JW11]|uniref:glycosyltransferase family 61 protein n=1 Tax=Pseudobutyrivibrio sp. JW11 TaxID=1855302 RepID=UPI0008EE2649|nr:glycosyltransferase family 61 protein [Pseudobutyrivibrio sp. JW11]SFO34717.1 Protein of unknown function [Pseudobutyrivibrio sp. JW11]